MPPGDGLGLGGDCRPRVREAAGFNGVRTKPGRPFPGISGSAD